MKNLIFTFIVALAFTTSINAQSLVYCSAGSYTMDEFISDVEVGSISNPSSYAIGGYANYTNISTDMLIGESYAIEVTNGILIYPTDECGIWIDWNQDGDFDDLYEDMIVAGSPGVGPYTSSIVPPTDAINGITTMRIRIDYSPTNLSPCGITSWGEVEDYSINVIGCMANANFSYYDLGLDVDFATDNYDSTFSVVWDFGDGNTISNINNPTHTYALAGTYTATLAVNDLLDSTCYDTVSYSITIDDCQTNAMFDYTVSNFTMDFAGYFVYDTTYITTWDLGDGTIITNQNIVNHTYPGSGTFTITYTVEDLNNPYCTESSTITIELGNCNIAAQLSWNAWGLEANFSTFNSSGYDLVWDFGDTTFTNIATPAYTFDSTGTYYVSLLITEPGNPYCSDFIDTNIFVDACVSNGSFTYSGIELEIDFQTQYYWDTANYYIEWQFGDGSGSVAYNDNFPTHTYISSGQYNVTCIIQDLNDSNCADTLIQTITVYPPCIVDAAFTWIDNGDWSFDFSTITTYSGDYTFEWNFGDGTSSTAGQAVNHIYNSAGTYSVNLIVTQTTNPNCYSMETASIVIPECLTDGEFTFSDTYLSVDFSAINTFDLANYSLSWNFGDGSPTIDNVFDVNHVYSGTGTYTAVLTVSNIINPNCVDEYSLNVTVVECVATASFTEVANNLEYNFITTSSPSEYSIVWDFGDGTTASNISSITHTYDTAGTYTVSLTITDLLEPTCTDTYTEIVYASTIGITDNIISLNEFSIYPNPVVNNLNLNISLIESSIFSVNIMNAVGQSVKNESFEKPFGDHILSFDVSNLPMGMYILKIEFDSNDKRVFKFIK
ncbi:MAG: PKD domain-containing protein [Bacteroidetes bacterium]|jgi:PKD repeat protein|nr:PKD domain-containing protein [Bacteroidota bacterium]MBT6686810.1 PKD domain-containing protein [Bacteroidota bacterium]MBT7144140.1 PKD domain-containing protein [Bacteroidota bacterium]MBT7490076.1 PKD domain-containing protein [Bacteroidota bacterium]